MVPLAAIRQYAAGQQIGIDVADKEIALHYALGLLTRARLMGTPAPGSKPGLLFKGGTALRKCVFGQTGRFSQDIDLDATHENGFEAGIEAAFLDHSPFHGISFTIPNFRYSADGNFSGRVRYEHQHGSGTFELQISYRLEPILDPVDLELVQQLYFRHVEFDPPRLSGLDPYEMIGEKVMACNRRRGGSAKDVYDLYLWAQRPFDDASVRRVTVLKAWTDRRGQPRYEPGAFLSALTYENYRWEDLRGLVPRRLDTNAESVCAAVRHRFDFLADQTADERALVEDQTSHRMRTLFEAARAEARDWARQRSDQR